MILLEIFSLPLSHLAPSCNVKIFLWRKSCGWDALKTCLPSLPFPVLGLPDFTVIAWPLHNRPEIPSHEVWKPDRPNAVYVHRQQGRHLVVHSNVITFRTSCYLKVHNRTSVSTPVIHQHSGPVPYTSPEVYTAV